MIRDNLLFLSQNIFCKIQKHEPYTLSRVCFNKHCKLSRLMCDQCIIEDKHINHKQDIFSFYDIQDYMDQTIKIDCDEIVEMLKDFLKLLNNILQQVMDDFLIMKMQFLSLFPKIDKPSYNGIQQYIKIIQKNIELRNQKIVFKGYSQIFRQFKQKIEILQVSFKKITDNMEKIIYQESVEISIDLLEPSSLQNLLNPLNPQNPQNLQNLQNLQNQYNPQNQFNPQNPQNQFNQQNPQNLQSIQNEQIRLQNSQNQMNQQNPQNLQNLQNLQPLNLKQISNKVFCNKSYHKSDLIANVCLFSLCKLDRLLCKKCTYTKEDDEGHYQHKQFCIPISEFDKQCAKFTVDNHQEMRIKQIKQELDDIVKDLDQDFLNILKPNQFIQMYLQKNEIMNYEDLNTAIEQLTNYVEINDRGDLKFKLSDENTLNLYIYSKFKNCAWNMYGLIKKQEPCIETAKQEQNEVSFLIRDEMKQQSNFYKQQCSQSIDIINLRIVKKAIDTEDNDIALLSKEIDPKYSSSFLFRINNQKGVIGIGFANSLLIKRDYKLSNLSKERNGIYMIASLRDIGKSYNHKDQDYNNISQKINFQQGHQYQLVYNPQNMGEQFCLQHIQDSEVIEEIKMPMVIEIKEQFHPFILIGLIDDEVELLIES